MKAPETARVGGSGASLRHSERHARTGIDCPVQHGWNILSTDSAPETSRPARPKKGGAKYDRLWPWYLITALYLGGCGLVLYDRGSEFGAFFNPADGSPGGLRLNEIGDIAAGIFAPLAFLWLFVATQLQRRELRLQREELEETRLVLAAQQKELEKAAVERNKQTEIMNRTLAQASSKDDYDLFGLDLYYLAKHCMQIIIWN